MRYNLIRCVITPPKITGCDSKPQIKSGKTFWFHNVALQWVINYCFTIIIVFFFWWCYKIYLFLLYTIVMVNFLQLV